MEIINSRKSLLNDLYHLLSASQGYTVSNKYEFILNVMTRVLKAMKLVHGAGMVHGDIKPHNILVKDDGTVSLADFSNAQAIGAAVGHNFVTAGYRPPEAEGGCSNM